MLELYYQQSLGNLAVIDSCHNANTLGYDRSFLIVIFIFDITVISTCVESPYRL